MENIVFKYHTKGKKTVGKTNWSKVLVESNQPKTDEENPNLVGKKLFKKVTKS